MFSGEFLITSLVVVLVPGTGVIYTVSTGLSLGWRASIAAAIGCTCGIIPHLAASILGLAAILHISALLFQAVKLSGAAYLLYLAWLMWREKGSISFEPLSRKSGFLQIATRGVLINILNPKLSVFFLAFLPLFLSSGSDSPAFDMFLMGTVFMAMTLAVFILYGISANGVRRYLADSPTVIVRLQRSFAVIFAALAAKLAMIEQ